MTVPRASGKLKTLILRPLSERVVMADVTLDVDRMVYRARIGAHQAEDREIGRAIDKAALLAAAGE